MTKEEATRLCAEIDNHAARAKRIVMSLITPATTGAAVCVNTVCPKCGGHSVVYRNNGPHVGEYCANCGRWLRWADKRTHTQVANMDDEQQRFGNHAEQENVDDFLHKKCEECEYFVQCDKSSDIAAQTCSKFKVDIPF